CRLVDTARPIHQRGAATMRSSSRSSPIPAKKGVPRAPRVIAARSRKTSVLTTDLLLLRRDAHNGSDERSSRQPVLERSCQCLAGGHGIRRYGDREAKVGKGRRIVVVSPPRRRDADVLGELFVAKERPR